MKYTLFMYVSSGEHGNTDELLYLEKILDKYSVDAYFCGHDHSLQHHFNPETNIHHFISGTQNCMRDVLTYLAIIQFSFHPNYGGSIVYDFR